MNDTLSVKPIVPAQVSGTVLEATARDFARASSQKSGYNRVNSALGALNPTSIRISHQPRKDSDPASVQRSLFDVEQSLTRVDGTGNAIRTDVIGVGLTLRIPTYATSAEVKAAVAVLVGAIMASNGDVVDQLFRGEH